ncbi:type II toxin-antitoxin system YoeB family toxin [Parasalinivibrio latis]
MQFQKVLDTDKLVYAVADDTITVFSCRYHY